eukprot:m.472715 g.472715  ORF g.472715 m.472715 type:complete len:418 (-) comp21662_c0_seq8:228-1481(-)
MSAWRIRPLINVNLAVASYHPHKKYSFSFQIPLYQLAQSRRLTSTTTALVSQTMDENKNENLLTTHLESGGRKLPEIPTGERLSPCVYRVLGLNPGPFTLTGTNTYLVGSGPTKILIDTGDGREEYISNLKIAMKETATESIAAIVLTHWHLDHIGGVPSVINYLESLHATKSAVSSASLPVYKYMPQNHAPSAASDGPEIDPYSIWPKDKFTHIAHGDVLHVSGATLEVRYAPGHADDHVVLVLLDTPPASTRQQHTHVSHTSNASDTQPVARALGMFTGDNVLGVGTTVFEDLGQYMNSLEMMKKMALDLDIQVLYPGHGPVVEDGKARLGSYCEHRRRRVEQVRHVLAGTHASLTCLDITKKVYTDVPTNLIGPASNNVFHVLRKLVADGDVRTDGDRYTYVRGSTGNPTGSKI